MITKDEALKLALDALETSMYPQQKQLQAITAIKEALAQPEFIKHEVKNADDWSEWVCPDPKNYLMKCCDCGLVHEAEFGVVRYKSETERDDCDMVDDPNLQAVFRMRRSEEWTPEDTAHRAGGLPMAQQEQEPVAYSYTSRITGAQGFSHHPMPRFVDSESWDIKPLYTQNYTHIPSPKQKVVGWKLVPIKPTDEMLKAMDECSTEGYDERLYAGHAASVYMAAWDEAPNPPEQEPEFIKHEVESAEDWSEWVCPDAKGYLMKCCDCGLVHEAEFGVVRYKSETEREDCEPVEDPNLQAVFRMRRSEQWSPEDTAHRAGGLPMAQPEQEPVAWRVWSPDGDNQYLYSEDGDGAPLYTHPPQRTWVGLTDEEISKLWNEWKDAVCLDHKTWAKAIEAELRSKNGY